ncbi:MAG TPA: hypothetical protein DDW52_06485 [Planctomycetaceae bacterium]|nr:hypothetical protein [Planctomycetaceae bacterium]
MATRALFCSNLPILPAGCDMSVGPIRQAAGTWFAMTAVSGAFSIEIGEKRLRFEPAGTF